jgi:hypothetical protein
MRHINLHTLGPQSKQQKGETHWKEITHNTGLKKGECIATASGTIHTICDNDKKIKEHAVSGTLSPTLPTVVRYVIHSNVGVKRHTGQGESTAHAAPNILCTFQKQSLVNFTAKKSISTPPPQQSHCFWNRSYVAWLHRHEPSRNQTMPITDVCSVMALRYQVLYDSHTT